jgi:hypothetical protein
MLFRRLRPLLLSLILLAAFNGTSLMAQQNTALLVVKSARMNESDSFIASKLHEMGFSTSVIPSTSARESDALSKSVVIISSTAPSKSVGTKFRNVPVPVVTWDANIYPYLGMTGPKKGTDFGTSCFQKSISLTGEQSELAAGYSGKVALSNQNMTLSWGVPASQSIKVATIADDPTKATLFAYEKGVQMQGLIAPARRVGLFMTNNFTHGLTCEAEKLIETAVLWATGKDTRGAKACPGDVTKTPLANGKWGGVNIELDVTDSGAQLQFNCAHGNIQGRIMTTPDGRFEATGEVIGYIGVEPPPNWRPIRIPAIYNGTITQNSLSIRITEQLTGKEIATFNLTKDADATFTACNRVQFETVASGTTSGITERKQIAIKSESEWISTWNMLNSSVNPVPPIPNVDFTQSMVILVTMGERTTAGYRVEITDITKETEGLLVKVVETSPGKGCVVPQVITRPYQIVVLERSEEAVIFNTQAVVKNCN